MTTELTSGLVLALITATLLPVAGAGEANVMNHERGN
jgi:hypothetical protein